jgi:hypothetical protein
MQESRNPSGVGVIDSGGSLSTGFVRRIDRCAALSRGWREANSVMAWMTSPNGGDDTTSLSFLDSGSLRSE